MGFFKTQRGKIKKTSAKPQEDVEEKLAEPVRQSTDYGEVLPASAEELQEDQDEDETK